MQSQFRRIWESLRSKPKKKIRRTVRLDFEVLEDRWVPASVAASSTISGVLFVNDAHTGVYAPGDLYLPGVTVSLVGTATSQTVTIADAKESGTTVTITTATPEAFKAGDSVTITGATVSGYNSTFTILTAPTTTTFTMTAASGLTEDTSGTGVAAVMQNTPVDVSTVTDANGNYSFENVLPGTYNVEAGADPELYYNTPSIGGASITITGGQTITRNIGYTPGYAASVVSVFEFLTETEDYPFAPQAATSRPTISHQIANQTVAAGTTGTFDLAGAFADADITNSEVTFNITANGKAEQVNMILFDSTEPQTVANFYDYINAGLYNDAFFTRETNTTSDGIGVLQAGGASIINGAGPQIITPFSVTVPDEFSGSNTIGTLAMANTGAANSESDEFFFNTADNTSLNGKYSVFGEAADPASEAVLESLSTTPTQNLSASSASAISTATVSTDGTNTVTITTSAAESFKAGQTVVVTGLGKTAYNGTFTIASVPSTTTFTYVDAAAAGQPEDTSMTGSAVAGPLFAQANPGLVVNEVPLNNVTGTANNFPTTAADYIVINSVQVDERNDYLTYSNPVVTNESASNVVTVSLTNEHLNLDYNNPGTATVSVTATNRFGESTTMSFKVTVAGTASTSTSTVAITPSSIQSGGSATITLTAKDANGVQEPTGGLTVTFAPGSTNVGTSQGTIGSVTDNGNGTYTATFIGTTAGAANTITATIGGVAVTTAAPSITVTPGAVSESTSTVAVNPAAIQVGDTTTVTLTALDANLNQETSGGLTVAFGLGAGSAGGSFGSVTDNHNGTYTATFTGTTAGTDTITATIGGAAVTTTAPTVTVVGPPDPTKSTIGVNPASIEAGGTGSTVTLTALDANGNQETVGGATVAFGLAGGSAGGTLSSVTDNHNGTYSATFTSTAAGTDTITATINTQTVTTASPTVTVTPGPIDLTQSTVAVNPSTISLSGVNQTTVTLTTKDSFGNQETSGGATVVFSIGSGTADGTFGPVVDNGDGTYSATFTGTITGTATIDTTINGDPVTSTAPTLTVNA